MNRARSKARKVMDKTRAPEPVTLQVVNVQPYQARLFEWMAALMMVGIAVVTTMSPLTVERGGFHYLHQVGFNAPLLALVFGIAGLARMTGLYANGRWPIVGPRIRVVAGLIASSIWIQMVYSLALWSKASGYISIGVPVYVCLALGEFISCWRAANDVGRC